MATEVLLPKIGFSMTEVESPAAGKIRILKPIGETYPVGAFSAWA